MKNLNKSFIYKRFNKISIKNFLHTISDAPIIKSESIIPIYSSPEISDFEEAYKNTKFTTLEKAKKIWYDYIKYSKNKEVVAKYYALMPMFFENKFSNAAEVRFIVSMGLAPQHQRLVFKCLEASGIVRFEQDLQDISPIPAEDYAFKKKLLRAAFPDFVDGDMLYINRKTLTTICFDKQGTWHKEGVNHEMLNLKNIFNEKNWYDHLPWDKEWY